MSCPTFRIPQYARLHPPSLTGFFWQIPKTSQALKHSLHFENVWVVFGYKYPLKVWQWEKEGEEARMISSLRMSSSLFKRWVCVCVVENLSRVFLSEWLPLHLWVMSVHIVWVKGKKVTFKKSPGRKSHRYLAGRPYLRNTLEIDNLAWLFSFQSCASHMPFPQELFSQTSH